MSQSLPRDAHCSTILSLNCVSPTLVGVACEYLVRGAPTEATDEVHKLNKFDTAEGLSSLRHAVDLDVPYPVLLYERHLGLPFGSHKNVVSELIGNVMEGEIESRLHDVGISARKTKRAEKVQGFDQAPDFIVPDEAVPKVVIEAKIANDDGTARDKVTRIRHLVQISRERAESEGTGFQVVACIEGSGFSVRRQDMRNLLTDLNGKVFTLRTLDQLISRTDLEQYVSRSRNTQEGTNA